MRPSATFFLVAAFVALSAACAQGTLPGPAPAETATSARSALSTAIKAYESGQAERLISQLDSAMIGYGAYAESIRRDAARLKQVRVQLLDTTVTAGDNIVYVSSAWEKRFVTANALKPQLHRGRTTFAMKPSGGNWRISGIAGDNLFSTPAVTAP
jgi:hypothetical protein